MKKFKNSLRCKDCLNIESFYRNTHGYVSFSTIDGMENNEVNDLEWGTEITCDHCDSENVERYEHLTREKLEKLVSAKLINITYGKLTPKHDRYDEEFPFMLFINGYEYDTVSDTDKDNFYFIIDEHNSYGRDIFEYISNVEEVLGYSNE